MISGGMKRRTFASPTAGRTSTASRAAIAAATAEA